MTLGRLRYHTPLAVNPRHRQWTSLSPVAMRCHRVNASAPNPHLFTILWVLAVGRQAEAVERHAFRSKVISTTSFTYTFNQLTDQAWLSLLHFNRADLLRMVPVLSISTAHTDRNRYAVTPLLSACVVLRRMAIPFRWQDLELLFGRYAPQLSEIFWEGMDGFLPERYGLLMGSLDGAFWRDRFALYADAVKDKSEALGNVVGFIDGTVIAVTRPGGDNINQRVVYNGHKRKYALKYQAVTTSCGLAMHLTVPIEGRRHDWTLYVQSVLDQVLSNVLSVNETQYCL